MAAGVKTIRQSRKWLVSFVLFHKTINAVSFRAFLFFGFLTQTRHSTVLVHCTTSTGTLSRETVHSSPADSFGVCNSENSNGQNSEGQSSFPFVGLSVQSTLPT